MKESVFLATVLFAFGAVSFAQVRPVEKSAAKPAASAPALTSVAVKYEGGMYGFSQKMNGTLKLDDVNLRLVFFGEDQKELFGIPYESLLVIYPQSKSVTTTTGNVVSHIPLPGAGLAGFIKEKRRYLVVQFNDPDVDAKGVVNFKLDNKETLDSVLVTLAEKARLEQRGDAFYRPRSPKKES
jgi:hypothetical protein